MRIMKILFLLFIFINFSPAVFAQDINNSTQENITSTKPQSEDIGLLLQEISKQTAELESAQDKILTLQKELDAKNQQLNQLKTDNLGWNDKFTLEIKKYELENQSLKDEIQQKNNELGLAGVKLVELTNKLNNFKNTASIKNIVNAAEPQEKNIKQVNFVTQLNSNDNESIEIKKQLNIANNTIIEQAKHLSEAYKENEKINNNMELFDRLIDRIIYEAENLYKQGKTTEATAIYETLSRLEVKNPKIYKNLALIYKNSGLNSESKIQLDKLLILFPNLTGNEKLINP